MSANKTRELPFVTAAEADRWNQLYDDRADLPGARWGLFQGYARERVLRRLNLCVNLIDSYEGKRVLDVACGGGQYGVAVSERKGIWFGMDISTEMLRRAENLMETKGGTGRFIRGDLSRLPFARNSFDVIFAAGILSYFPDRGVAEIVKQLADLLRPGGQAVVQTIRLDVFSWFRSRLPGWVPRPIRLPGPLYPRGSRVLRDQVAPTSLRIRKMIEMKKWLVVPFQTIYLLEKGGSTNGS